MKKYGILGYPLGHSLSPQIHKRLFELSGVTDYEYSVMEIPEDKLTESFDKLKSMAGFNITIPHKISIIDMCDELDATAKRYNSVNCVACGERVVGYNTDCVGFTMSIKAMGASLGGDVLLLGCGGVGRMMAIETVLEGGRLTIAVREEDLPVAKALCEELREMKSGAEVSYCLLCDAEGKFDLCVNATPVGMYPKTDFSPLTEQTLDKLSLTHFFEVIYNPGTTKLMRLMSERGVNVSGGMDMLVWQAVAAHTIWDGSTYKDEDIKQLILDMKELV